MDDKLTPQQELDKIDFYQRYKKIGLDTGECDKSAVEELTKMYKIVGKKPPAFVWVDNPWEANVIAETLKSNLDETHPTLIRQLEDNIDAGTLIDRETIEWLSKEVDVNHNFFVSGNCNAYWVCFLQFGKHIGVEYKKDKLHMLGLWESLIKKIGWFAPFENVCIVCNKPAEIYLNDADELHCEDKKAIRYRRGGSDIYSLNGVTVTEQIVMHPETITIEEIEANENIEIRRIMMEQMGIGIYLEKTGAKVIDGDMTFVANQNDDRYIPRALMEDKEGRKFLVGTDGSNDRVYYMQVPDDVKTCIEASSALAGFDESNIIAQG